ncbi:Integral membrane ankyrin-repeat protein, partial [Globisporangium splendens]
MDGDRNSPPRKRVRLTSPRANNASPGRRDDAAAAAMDVDAQSASAGAVDVGDASTFLTQQQSEESGAAVEFRLGDDRMDALPGDSLHLAEDVSSVSDPRRFTFLSFSALFNNAPVLAQQEGSGRVGMAETNFPVTNEHGDMNVDDEEVMNATMMEPEMMMGANNHASEESSGTDDEELQQLTRVTQDPSVIVDMLNGEGGGEVRIEDLLHTLFVAAKEAKATPILQCLRIIKKNKNAEELMKRAVTEEDDTGLTLLMISVRNNMPTISALLIQEGADVNQWNEKRTYALLLAAQKGLDDITKLLLENGANEESKNMSLIPASHFGHLSAVQLLLEFGANQNYSNKKGTTPLMRAAQEGRENVVRFLISKGADACAANTRQGSTALLLAAKRGHTAAVESLLTAGADIFMKDDRDKTAAETANRRGHLDLFLKITVSNQIRLMREGLRRERSFMLMSLSTLYVMSRATLAPAYYLPQRRKDFELMDRTIRLPKPLLENIALYLPLCRMWDRQLRYLVYEAPFQPSRVVKQGIDILDEILLAVGLEMRSSLKTIKQECESYHANGHLALLRDSAEFRSIFTTESRLPMPTEMLKKFRRLADVQGALRSYAVNNAIQFGPEVAQDIVALLTELLDWDAARKRAESSVDVLQAATGSSESP